MPCRTPWPAQPNTLNVSTLPTFVDPLPFLRSPSRAACDPLPSSPKTKLPYYRLAARPIEMKIHRDLKPTRFWSYGASVPGPTLEMRSGEGVLVEWANELPQQHFLPIDYRLHGAEAGKPQVRIVSHLHGAHVPPDSDGYPEDWFVPGKSALYHYPNQQDAAMLWYHDHAMGINRLNIYAGLFGAAFIRDTVEDALNLPSGKYEVPLTHLRSPAHARGPALLSGLRRSRARPGFRKSSAMPCWSTASCFLISKSSRASIASAC